jgi:protein-S-isoprenylcysteine O-methyltransferase Ste14
MKPYFDINHTAGLLLFLVSLAWIATEAAEHSQTLAARKGASPVRHGGWRLAALTCVIGVNAALFFAPRVVPAAAIRPPAAAFAVGLVVMLAGVALRNWSFKTLGDYFTLSVLVNSDQPVISSGPYRVLRHPGYAGLLLACAGVGLAAANWAALAVAVLLPLALLLWRIRFEEQALMAMLGDRYGRYAAGHKRLVPLVW